ncbi:isopentenyl phosphate kinase [Methanomicrobium sp. W14]|uniref:isopentenyl phosphate kinase n=1 Tax=Methanomicrobium sp. W14 TaxID=2817839 RepID=UPI001AE633B8|nr:isopentenyl phosphate kinase [Methanomicrobium sp. W14]MBP2132110.1 isopentenyl phosphate kinase [Methanomicrobium sp. W14]
MPELIILKLGGSVITDKSKKCSVNEERISALSREISQRKDIFPVIIHGAGSCGHPEAKEHHLDKGLDQTNRAGIFITHRAVKRLNNAVVNALRASGVESVGIHPLDACTAKNGRLISFECRPLELLIKNGVVPVLHGDVVMDEDRGACIVSGDQLVSYLACAIHAERIGLATDVPGVLKDGRVIPVITSASARSLEINESGNTDVTGGMRGKINELLMLAENGIESSIFHVSRTGDFLDGRDHGGTVVTSERS